MIPSEVGLIIFKVDYYKKEKNDKELHLNLDLLDKVKMGAEQRLLGIKTIWLGTIMSGSNQDTSTLENWS